VQWDVERFADHIKFFKQGEGVQERVKEELARVGKYIQLPETERHCDEPQTIVDIHGRILVWSLPGILSAKRVVSPPILFRTPDSESGFSQDYNLVAASLREPISKSTSQDSWRLTGFNPPEGGGEFGAGVLRFSPGYFMQARNVSTGSPSKPVHTEIWTPAIT
jgi:hypothetical protein